MTLKNFSFDLYSSDYVYAFNFCVREGEGIMSLILRTGRVRRDMRDDLIM